MHAKKFFHTNLAQNLIVFKTEDNVTAGKPQEINENIFSILTVTEEGGVGSELDPDTDPDL